MEKKHNRINISFIGVVMTPENYRNIYGHETSGPHATSIEHRLFTDDFLNNIETWRSK